MEELSWALDKMRVFIDNTLRVRILGVGSIGLCLSAMGGFDAWVSLASSWKSYDLAAGQVIMQEAGAEFNMHGRRIVAGPAALCAHILELIDFEEGAGERPGMHEH